MELFLLVDIVNKVNALSNGEVEIGHVDTLAPGATATASITGKFPLQQLNLGIPRGTQGVPGPLGPVGPIGPTGLTGAPGANSTVPGPVGPKGDTGPQGVQGIQGKVGLTGGPGPTGPQGPIGPIGLTGNTGSQGAIGPAGPTGAASTVPGPTGPIGPQGLVGPTGAKGDTGAKGATGNTGPIGPLGPIGPEGPMGPEGVPGPQGPRGIPGVGEGDTLPSFWDGVWDMGPPAVWVEDPPGSGEGSVVYTDPLPGQVSYRDASEWDPDPADYVFLFHPIDRDGIDQSAVLLSAIAGNTVVMEGGVGWISMTFKWAWMEGDFIHLEFDKTPDQLGQESNPAYWPYVNFAAGTGFAPKKVVHPTPLSGQWKRGSLSYGVNYPEWSSTGDLAANNDDLSLATTLAFNCMSESIDPSDPLYTPGPDYTQALLSLGVGSRVFIQAQPVNPLLSTEVVTGLLFELTSDPVLVGPYSEVAQFDVTCIHSVGDAVIQWEKKLLVGFLPIPAGGGGGGGGDDTGWLAAELLYGWLNYGGQCADVGYRRIGTEVTLRGRAFAGNIAGPIFQLPEGFRPPKRYTMPGGVFEMYTGESSVGTAHRHVIGSGAQGGAAVVLDLWPNGDVAVLTPDSSNGWVSLDGVKFYTD